ncbi:hypothetical protein SAY87_014070 [Trapa incisa]|uniref:Uncharacterized protein n=1 Tax=Trapa incisa TaxID=236973 RepID=A0AAN7GS39_9MYRT|nr:hypothetical protein SAY87_014070 [Trapa incisa]
MGRCPSAAKSGLKKGPWDADEDKKLADYIKNHGTGSWISLPKLAGLNRCGKSCRLRWINYLRPDIKRGGFTEEEERTILRLHAILGNKWSAIAMQLPGRTDNEIKNFWNTHLKKKLVRMGCDPMTHEPRTDIMACLKLLAMANDLRNSSSSSSLIGQSSQFDANAIKLQYLNKHLLQSSVDAAAASSLVNSTSLSHLLLLLQGNSILNSLSQMGNQPSFPLGATTMFTDQPLHCSISSTTPSAIPTDHRLQLDPQVPFTAATFQDMPPGHPELGAQIGDQFFQGVGNLSSAEDVPWWGFDMTSESTGADGPSTMMTETTATISNLGDAAASTSGLHGGGSESSSPWRESGSSYDPWRESGSSYDPWGEIFIDDPAYHSTEPYSNMPASQPAGIYIP